MSLITRCPACKTLFKVVPDQLRVSAGWVRCGQCDEIFDASAHLQSSRAEAEPAKAIEPTKDSSVDFELADDHAMNSSVLEETVSTQTGLTNGAAKEAIEPDLGEVIPRGVVPAHELSFMRDAKSTSRWHGPLVRVSLLLASLLLCLGLALQLLVQERDRIVAMEPRLKPRLAEICDFAQCTLAPLKQIESIVIDSSSFNKIRGDVYRLNFTLRNTAAFELAMPAIELSLTDANDQALMRRVFRAGELSIQSATLAPASESSTSLTLSVKTNSNAGPDRVAGYRILAFYP
jgi:predicted Zn finger-like uncharacterized protein